MHDAYTGSAKLSPSRFFPWSSGWKPLPRSMQVITGFRSLPVSKGPAMTIKMTASTFSFIAFLFFGINSPPGLAETTGSSTSDNPATLKFTIPENDFYPENIAFDPVSGDYFLGSMSHPRIIRIREDGTYEDFISTPVSGLSSVIGMKVDAERRTLWACTGRFNLLKDFESALAESGIIQFSLDDGSVLYSWMIDEEQTSPYHIFNDVVLTSSGEAYATTTLYGKVYKFSSGDEPELVLQLDENSHNNGITIDSSEEFLFLTIDRSIYRLDLESKELVELSDPTGSALQMVDGLYFYKNSLVAMKPRLNSVSQILLDSDLSLVERIEILAQSDQDFVYPTTGVIVDSKLVFVGTSYANIPRNPDSTVQHPDIKIYEVELVD